MFFAYSGLKSGQMTFKAVAEITAIHVGVSAVYETFTVQRSYDSILPGLSKTLEKSSLTAGFYHTPLKTASAASQPTPRSHNKGAGQAAVNGWSQYM